MANWNEAACLKVFKAKGFRRRKNTLPVLAQLATAKSLIWRQSMFLLIGLVLDACFPLGASCEELRRKSGFRSVTNVSRAVTLTSYAAALKSRGEIVNLHLPFSRSHLSLCDETCLVSHEMRTRSLQPHTNHSCIWRHDVPDMFSNMGDSWPKAPTVWGMFGQPSASSRGKPPKGTQVRPLLGST